MFSDRDLGDPGIPDFPAVAEMQGEALRGGAGDVRSMVDNMNYLVYLDNTLPYLTWETRVCYWQICSPFLVYRDASGKFW